MKIMLDFKNSEFDTFNLCTLFFRETLTKSNNVFKNGRFKMDEVTVSI